jgi:hypothetical protein
VLVLLPLCFTGRALIGGQVFAPIDLPFAREPLASFAEEYGIEGVHNGGLTDIGHQIIPWQHAVRHAWRNAEWPLRNPFSLSGDALAGSAQAAVLDPIRVVGYALPLSLSLSFNATAVLFVAGLSMFLFLRDIACREEASLIGAAGWMFCGFLSFFVQYPMGTAVAVTPLVMLGARRVARQPGVASAGILTVAFVVEILAGHPESTVHVVALAAIYGLWELVGQERSSVLRGVGAAVAAGAVAVSLCAVSILPIAETLPQTREYWHRKLHFAHVDRSVDPAGVLARLRPSFVPFAYGVSGAEKPAREHIPDRFHPWSSAYVGSVLFAPALFGLWRGRWRGRWVTAGIGLGGLLAGASAPGVADLLARLPLFDVSLNKRLIFAGALALCVLAAVGMDAWAGGRRPRALGWLHAAVLVTLSLAIFTLWGPMTATGLSEPFLWRGALLELVPVAILSAIHLGTRRVGLAMGMVLALLLVQRVSEARQVYPTLPRAAFYPMVPPLDALPQDDPPYRIVGLHALFPPNTSTLYGLEDVRGDTPLVFRYYSQLFELWNEPRPWFNTVPSLDSPMLSLMNVRFALVPIRTTRPKGWRTVTRTPRCRLLENRRVLERAFVPKTVTVNLPDRSIREKMGSATSFAQRAWITTNHRTGPREVRNSRNGPGTVSIRRDGLGYELEASMEGPGWVVVSENAWRGWRAISDAGPIPVHRANLSFLAIHLDAGDHLLRLVFRPRSFAIGATVSGVTILLLAVAAVARSDRLRRVPRPESDPLT